MSDRAYHRLAPFIQEYIYAHGWTDLRQVQAEACRVIFETDAHLLIAAGTAAGKTEAAFLPVLTLLHESPSSTIGAMYIGPIKALINDQFDRLNDLLKEADIPVWAWHGDISQSHKQRLLKSPQGVLQTTPESLESLLINHSSQLDRLFGDLRFIVIDEIHAFIGTERGSQILCQLARLAKLTGNQPRRIGLSATLGDYVLAENWLAAGSDRTVITPEVQVGQRTLHLSLEHFYQGEPIRAKGDSRESAFSPYHQYLFRNTQSRKCLIFANNRTEAETAIASLRQVASAQGLPDIYHVHHGSISVNLRAAAEQAMRDPGPAVTAATVTFEMGIDIGQLERVIQLESPPSVASFLQRLGRSGRRGSPADMRFVCAEVANTDPEFLPDQIPWQLLQCIAIIQLYLEERWIEPVKPLQYPYSLLYHQTMSILAALGELSPAALAQQVLTLPTFRTITPAIFRQLLHNLLELDHIQKTAEGSLILGLAGERIVRNFKFYATFADREDYTVREGTTELGSITLLPEVGDRIGLAGRAWQVLDIDDKTKTIFVQPTTGTANSAWQGGSGTLHTKVLQRMRQILFEDVEYRYLQPGAKDRIAKVRDWAKQVELDRHHIFQLDNQTCCIFPWLGTTACRTLERFLRYSCRESLGLRGVSGRVPYFLVVQLGKAKLEHLLCEITGVGDRQLTEADLLGETEVPKLYKYDDFIPPELLRQAFLTDYLDVAELGEQVRDW